jgi:DNA helicase-2/ATP-dependent DNA helicase PcrA
MEYTSAQKRAIKTLNQNLQIIACAGSGKTQVISQRIVEALKGTGGRKASPGEIVAFAFTEKAAGELKERIRRTALNDGLVDTGFADMFVGTIHAYCLRILQQAPIYKFLKFGVLTEIQQRLLIDRNSKKSGLTEVPLLTGGTLKTFQDSHLYQVLLSMVEEGSIPDAAIPPMVSACVQKYEKLLEEKRYLDYSGMVRHAVSEIRGNRELRRHLAKTVKYLTVDEYQDVNSLQEELIGELAGLGANICVVGDDDQTIYQWRGSDVQNIISFAKRYPNVATVRLNENFRSSKGIVETARRVIEVNADRLTKKMISTDAQPFQNGDVLALQFPDQVKEAAWIAEKVVQLRGASYQDKLGGSLRGLAYSDMSILVRAWKDAKEIVEALEAKGIPSLGGGINSIFDTPEVRCIREAFYLLADHTARGRAPSSEQTFVAASSGAFPGLTLKNISAGRTFLRGIRKRIPLGSDNQLFLQRVFLDLLESMELREDRIGTPSRTGEVIFFNLGKFSQVITDFEQINFHSEPSQLYTRFAGFLEHQAPGYYPEEVEETAHAKPDAVRIMTVHQAKGMQWPVVFVPCLRANKFPSRRMGGRSVWHIIDDTQVPRASQYKGTVEDERRLFYVAMTRAERFLFCSWGPVLNNQQQRRASEFLTEFSVSNFVLGKDVQKKLPKLPVQARKEEEILSLTFSELKYYFDCPYQFKLRFLYGFDSPINRAIGYGKSLHNALCEIHSKALAGTILQTSDAERLIDDHLHLPFANSGVRENTRKAAIKAVKKYLATHGANLHNLQHAERVIELDLGKNISVAGRIDLIRRADTGDTIIVDFKSGEDTQPKEMSQLQLQVYAAGYEKAVGKKADLLEIHNLEVGHIHREAVDGTSVGAALTKIIDAGDAMRKSILPKHSNWMPACTQCDMAGICRNREAT